jgi:hypothetical protein
MNSYTQIVPVKVGTIIVHVCVAQIDQEQTAIQGEAKVAARIPSFETVAQGIEEMSRVLVAVFEKVAPDKVSVEFNVGISMDAGKLVALFFDTTATGSMKISLQWGKGSNNSNSDE